MTPRTFHSVEKIQIRLAAILAAVAAYYVIWGLVRPADPGGPMVFLPTGSYAAVALLCGAMCVLAAACGVVTISARPHGAILAMAFGAGGLSLHSEPIRSLLWERQGELRPLYWQMAGEVVLLTAVLVVAVLALVVGRALAAAILPKLVWQDPLAELSDEEREAYNRAVEAGRKEAGDRSAAARLAHVVLMPLSGLFVLFFPGTDMPKLAQRETATKRALCFLVTFVIGVAAVMLLMKSSQRGQLLFAVLAGCFLGTWLGQMAVPIRSSIVSLALPIVMAVGFYVLAALSNVQATDPDAAWMGVSLYARVLPIDWVSAGLGGSMLGHWVSLRMREMKFLEQQEQEEAGEGD